MIPVYLGKYGLILTLLIYGLFTIYDLILYPFIIKYEAILDTINQLI